MAYFYCICFPNKIYDLAALTCIERPTHYIESNVD